MSGWPEEVMHRLRVLRCLGFSYEELAAGLTAHQQLGGVTVAQVRHRLVGDEWMRGATEEQRAELVQQEWPKMRRRLRRLRDSLCGPDDDGG